MGGKAGNLHHLSRHGIPVPPWFCVSAEMCQRYMRTISDKLNTTLNDIDYSNQEAVNTASASIKQLICNISLSPEDSSALQEAVSNLGVERYAVRSSALAEDSSKDSFAGQLDTYLYVTPDDVEAKTKECWASGYGSRSLIYMANRGINAVEGQVAVVIQAMVDSDVSGVMFMANPTGSLDEMVIVAGYGLGEGIVSDQVESDMYIFDHVDKIWHVLLNTKKSQIIRDPETGHGTVNAGVQESIQDEEALSEPQRVALYDLGKRISQIYDHFQDIEWALAGDKLYITQSRPITTIPKGERSVFDNSNVVESYPGITKPLTYSHVRYGYEILFRNAVLRVGVPKDLVFDNHQVFRNLVGYLSGRIYYNLGNWYRMFSLIPGAKGRLGVWEEMLGIEKGLRDAEDVKVSKLAVLKCFANILRYFVFLTPHSNKIQEDFGREYADFRATDLSNLTNHELISLYQTIISNMLYGWEITLLNDGYTFVFSGLVRSSLKKYGLSENLFGGLMSGEEELESVMPVRSIVRIAELARSHSELLDWVAKQTANEGRELTYDNFPDSSAGKEFRDRLDRHLDLFGDRCVEELKIESLPFRDNPKALLELVQTYSASDVNVAAMVEKERKIRADATNEAAQGLRFNPFRKLWFAWILSMARRSVRYRESSRLDRARSFGIARDIFHQLGDNLADEGAIDAPGDILYLSVEEVLGFVSGSSINRSVKWLIEERKKDEEDYKNTQLADRIKTQGTVYLNSLPPRYPAHIRQAALNGELGGIGCSTGIVTAEAIVVEDPKTVKGIEGKILVSQMTDPGWVFLMISAAGLVVEKGSLLSHTAIIGRELGVPTVVGVSGATIKIQTGDVLTVNGQTGTIVVESRAQSSEG